MIRSITLLVLALFAFDAQTCPIDPWYRVAKDYERFFEEADVVFLGKLDSYEKSGKYDQLADFTVVKSFKGVMNFGESVTVKNRHNSSCSRLFHPVNSAFYVFAKMSEADGLIINGYATFVPMSVALETDMGLK